MIVDSSAVIAAITGEPSSARIIGALATAERRAVGAPTLVETGIVLVARLGPAGRTVLVRFCDELEIDSLPFTDVHVPLALDAFQRFGKGRHPAALNFGDCMTYATAAVAGEPLLCIGDDFAQTDLETVALPDT
jgi:ribonuclease VapC